MTSDRLAARWLAAVFVALVLVLAASAPAAAHARLTTSDPAPGSALGEMPARITMTFSESVDPGYSSASLLAADGSSIALGPPALAPGGDRTLIIPIPNATSVPRGVYTLVWRVLSATDGHVTSGTLAFSAGTGAAPTSGTGVDQAVRPPVWRVAIRWLELAALAIAVGGFAFRAIFGQTAPMIGRASFEICALLMVALLLGLQDQATIVSGRAFLHAPPLAVYRNVVFDSSGGRWWLVRFTAAIVMLAFSRVAFSTSRRWPALVGAAAGLLALFSRSVSGHAAGVPRQLLATAADWLHLTTVSFWFGGLVFLWLTLRVRPGDAENAGTIARFSILALVSVVVLIATGFISAALHVAGPRSLRTDDYGLVLIAKHLLFVPALIAAGVNLLIVAPRLKRDDPARVRAAIATARRLIGMELAFGAAVLIAAGALTELAPADGPLAVDVASRITTINQAAPAGDLKVQLLSVLTGQPEDRYLVVISDANGKVPANLQRVIVVSHDSANTAIGDRFDAEPLPGSPGTYFFPAVRIGLAAVWDLDLIVRRAGVNDVSGSVQIDVRGAVVQPPRLVNDHWRWPRLTFLSWTLAPLALLLFIAGVVGVRRLPGLEPIAGGLILTMTVLIAAGFLVQAIRSTVPVTAGADLVSPTADDPGAVVRGGAIYAAYCLACHGSAGEGVNVQNSGHAHGDSAGLTSTQNKRATDGDLYWWISSGVAGTSMPAYDPALSDAERWDVVAYVRELQKMAGKTAPQPTSAATP